MARGEGANRSLLHQKLRAVNGGAQGACVKVGSPTLLAALKMQQLTDSEPRSEVSGKAESERTVDQNLSRQKFDSWDGQEEPGKCSIQ